MKHLQRVVSLCFALILLISLVTPKVALADETTNVNFRLVLSQWGMYASCSVFLERYDSLTSTEPIETKQFTIGRVELWERKIALEPGYYQVVYVSVLGAWQAQDWGNTERFQVKGNEMTVYVAVDTEEYPAELPPQWLVYGQDKQIWHIWDGTPDLTPGNPPTEPEEPTTPPTEIPGETLPTDPDTGTIEDPNNPGHGTRPTVPTLPPDSGSAKEPTKQSVKVGNIVFYSIIGLILLVCFILWHKVKKDRGA